MAVPQSYEIKNIRKDPVPSGQMVVYWLGGSGIVLKFANKKIVCIDPYLSDSVERTHGFRRLSLAPLLAEELRCDVLLISHDHPDHLDVDSLEAIRAGNPSLTVIASSACKDYFHDKPIEARMVRENEVTVVQGFTITATPADHGEQCPEAVGFMIEYEGRKVYFTGDTSYNRELLASSIASQPEIIIPCINGAYGNLNEEEAARLVRACGSKIAIPCHFWLFAEHGGCPGKFKTLLEKTAGDIQLVLLKPGRGEII